MEIYVTVLAGPSAAESQPVVSSSDPEVVEATIAAIKRRLKRRGDDKDASAKSDPPGPQLVSRDNGPGGADG